MNEKQFLKLTYQSQELLKDIQDGIEQEDKSKVNRDMDTLMAVMATLQRMWKGEQLKRWNQLIENAKEQFLTRLLSGIWKP